MSGKHIIHQLSIEDLVALAEGADQEVVMEKLTDAARFIFEMRIKHGEEKIPATLIYHTYKVWKGWDQKRQSKPFFFRDFKKHFTPFRTEHGMCYLLNPKPFDLSDETKWLVRKEEREAKRRKKNS